MCVKVSNSFDFRFWILIELNYLLATIVIRSKKQAKDVIPSNNSCIAKKRVILYTELTEHHTRNFLPCIISVNLWGILLKVRNLLLRRTWDSNCRYKLLKCCSGTYAENQIHAVQVGNGMHNLSDVLQMTEDVGGQGQSVKYSGKSITEAIDCVLQYTDHSMAGFW